MHALRTFAAVAALWLLSAGAGAQVTSKGDKTCQLEGMNVVAFGLYDSTSEAPLDVQGQVSYRCFNAKSARGLARPNGRLAAPDTKGKLIVQISLSTGGAGSFNRAMRGSPDRLLYNLYLDAQHAQVWGDGTGGTTIYSAHAQPNNHLEVVPVFGRVFAGQDVAGGAYLDNIIVTLDF